MCCKLIPGHQSLMVPIWILLIWRHFVMCQPHKILIILEYINWYVLFLKILQKPSHSININHLLLLPFYVTFHCLAKIVYSYFHAYSFPIKSMALFAFWLGSRHYWRLCCRKSCIRRGLKPERGIWASSCCGAGEHEGTLPGADPGAGNSWWAEGTAFLAHNKVVSSQGTLQCPFVMDQFVLMT